MPRRLQADLLLLVICAAWGATFVLEQAALRHVSTLLFLFLRFGVAAVALLAAGGNPFRRPGPGMLVGVFLFLGCFLQAQGLRLTSPSKSAFITGLCVILVPIAYSALHRAWPGWGVAIGALLALVGLALITGLAHQNLGLASMNRGDIWTLACAVAFAAHILLMGHYSPRCRPRDLAAGQVLTGVLLGALTFWWAEPARLDPAPVLWWAVAVTGLICTAAAYLIQACPAIHYVLAHRVDLLERAGVCMVHLRRGAAGTSGRGRDAGRAADSRWDRAGGVARPAGAGRHSVLRAVGQFEGRAAPLHLRAGRFSFSEPLYFSPTRLCRVSPQGGRSPQSGRESVAQGGAFFAEPWVRREKTEPAKGATDARATATLPFARFAGSFFPHRVPRVPQNTLHPGPHSPARFAGLACVAGDRGGGQGLCRRLDTSLHTGPM